ncbi:hypothetical protein CFAM422_011499 [Trichoderma lentiforme]|uniref:Uncharacterized protein n=1 Tax=Trichoderma lentiforme TaxID=1567552 RepID=A0A9P4X453_9HYPO|nr:hypothetical protein CFAM422_011499 [Trichoderma lentiforme]
MTADNKERLCKRLMGAVFCVFVGNDYPDPNCFNNCVQECLDTEIFAGGPLTLWVGWQNVANILIKCTKYTRRKSCGGSSSVYGCPKAVRLMSALARFCLVDEFPRHSAGLERMYHLRAIEHARTAVIHDSELTSYQAYLWVNREGGSAPEEVPEEKEGDEKKDADEKKIADKTESSADIYINIADEDSNMADNEDSTADNGSGTTDIGSGRANDDSSSRIADATPRRPSDYRSYEQ